MGTWKSVLLQLMGLLVNPQETLQDLLGMSQLVVGQTDVTPHGASRVHTEGTVWRQWLGEQGACIQTEAFKTE